MTHLRIAGTAVLLTWALSCHTQQPQTPPMPEYTTAAGKACGQRCQDDYAKCKFPCSPLLRGADTSRQRKQCSDECDAALADCYSKCE